MVNFSLNVRKGMKLKMKITLPEFTLEKVDFFDEQHIRYIEGLITDPEVKRFLPYFEHGLYISKNIGLLTAHYVLVKEKKPVGYVFFSAPFLENGKQNAEIRYIIDPNYRNRGLGSKAVQQSTDYILSHEKISNLRAFIDPENLASLAVIQKAGFIETDQNLDGLGFTKPRK